MKILYVEIEVRGLGVDRDAQRVNGEPERRGKDDTWIPPRHSFIHPSTA